MCNGVMCQVTSERNCQNTEFRTHRVRGTAGSSLTFVRDLTFDLTFCRLFSFFLLKAFFPLKANSDTQFFHALHAWLMVTAKHVFHKLSFVFKESQGDDVSQPFSSTLLWETLFSILTPYHQPTPRLCRLLCGLKSLWTKAIGIQFLMHATAVWDKRNLSGTRSKVRLLPIQVTGWRPHMLNETGYIRRVLILLPTCCFSNGLINN